MMKEFKSSCGIFEPGKYWIGDLCYVLHESWDDVCSLIIVGNFCNEGQFRLPDGRLFAMYNTYYGDGTYRDNEGRTYGVDSGSLGCIKYDAINQDADRNDATLGMVVEFPTHFMVCNDNGRIKFGHVIIDTIGEEEEEEAA